MTSQFKLHWIEEHKGCFDPPPFHALAVLAIKEGLYSENTNIGDIEISLMHVWHQRKVISEQAISPEP